MPWGKLKRLYRSEIKLNSMWKARELRLEWGEDEAGRDRRQRLEPVTKHCHDEVLLTLEYGASLSSLNERFFEVGRTAHARGQGTFHRWARHLFANVVHEREDPILPDQAW